MRILHVDFQSDYISLQTHKQGMRLLFYYISSCNWCRLFLWTFPFLMWIVGFSKFFWFAIPYLVVTMIIFWYISYCYFFFFCEHSIQIPDPVFLMIHFFLSLYSLVCFIIFFFKLIFRILYKFCTFTICNKCCLQILSILFDHSLYIVVISLTIQKIYAVPHVNWSSQFLDKWISVKKKYILLFFT